MNDVVTGPDVVAAFVDKTGVEVDLSGDKPNTLVSYLYRDADNYKVSSSVVFAHRIEVAEIDVIANKLNNELFIPGQVHLADLQHTFGGGEGEWIDERDHPWHEITSIGYTDIKPTEARSVKEFVSDLNAVTTWDESYRPAEYPDMLRRAHLRSIAEAQGEELELQSDEGVALTCSAAMPARASELPVLTSLKPTDIITDRSAKKFAVAQEITARFQTEDGDIVGEAGAGRHSGVFVKVPRSAFAQFPAEGEVFLVARGADNQDVARPNAHDQPLSLGRD